MKFSSSAPGRRACVLGIIVVALLSGLFSGRAMSAQPEAPAATPQLPAATVERPPPAAELEIWRRAMKKIPTPKSGCFTSTYPKREWEEVPCTTAPQRPYQPGTGGTPANVGGSNGDFSAKVSGALTSATGSMTVTGVTSESGPPGANSFSLQLNTNTFSTNTLQSTLCKGQSGCVAWQQYIYSNLGCSKSDGSTSCVFIQYWLINHTKPCPTSPTVGGNTWTFAAAPPGTSAGSGCFINGKAVSVPDQTIAGLGGLKLTGNSSSSAQSVQVETSAGKLSTASDSSDLLGIGNNWNTAEYNVFGDCCVQTATFLPTNGVTIVVKINVDNGSPFAPTCASTGFTAETNNLTLISPCCSAGGASPSVTFTESNVPGATATCACGAVSEACCNSGAACGPSLVCDSVTNECDCGGFSQPCCQSGQSCGPGLSCDISVNVCTCGGLEESCCNQGAPCQSGLVCSGNRAAGSVPPAYTCVGTCGYQGDSCCNGSSCFGGLVCAGGTCSCGALDQPCCIPNGTCNFNLTCADGFCHPSTGKGNQCAQCRQQEANCVARCGNDTWCKCMCGNSQTSCFEENSCGIPGPFQNCGSPPRGEMSPGTGPQRAELIDDSVIPPAVGLAADDQPAAITKGQADAILDELRQIRQLLDGRQNAGAAPAPSPTQQQIDLNLATDVYALGRSDAPVTVIEFSDYQCPFCRQFHLATFQQLKKDFIDTGKVRFVSRDLPLPMHEHALKAAEAARCAGDQGKFWQMRDALISSASRLNDETIVAQAEPLAIDLARFRQCLSENKHSGEIQRDVADATSLRVNGTPTFIIGKSSGGHVHGVEVIGAQPYASFEKTIQDALSAGQQ
jgi:protein-disulfide isomerase